MDDNGIYTLKDARLAIIPDTPEATYAVSCQAATLPWVERIDFTQLRKGTQLFLRSYSGRFGFMKITSMPDETPAREFVFHGVVWGGP